MNRLIFEHIIRTLLEEEFTSLNVRSFRGREDRLNVFLDALKDGTPIPLTNGKSAVIKQVEILKKGQEESLPVFTDFKSQKGVDKLKSALRDLNSGDKLYLTDVGDQKHSITAFAKTTELGGKGKGFQRGTEGESLEVSNLQKEIDTKGGGKGVTIQVGEKIYPGIVRIEKVPGFKKADFRLMDSKENAVIFIQHKSPQHQQMSGIGREPIRSFPEVEKFTQEVYDLVQKSPKKRLEKPYSKPIESEELKTYAIYGVIDGKGNGVHLYSIGRLSLKDVGENRYEITSTGGTYTYPQPLPVGDTPTLVATYRGGRNQKVIGSKEVIPDTRIGIYPASYVKGS